MASKPSTVDFIVEQAAAAGLSSRKMFGEYALFCQGKLVALVCDDQLFVKPTAEGRAYAEPVTEAPPYPSAKPCLVIDGDRWDDRNWLAGLFAISAANLLTPAPKKRRPK
ncbi:hypothetical protein RHAL1_04152 [Beijerinckiaceae bacterium RH AL1]|nr:hypothetical protein RHCH11_RHCH11_04074 [Beijerinckiaceae bacterium RH CH11]VVB50131.1 hypothetical protein RHAL8_04071 [Beijerinckiaceae bacterium RH AL8]VVC57212.1 hypothetical protein RHAL1_04152 [Beijerinckiaceae bacterium RH AL1]